MEGQYIVWDTQGTIRKYLIDFTYKDCLFIRTYRVRSEYRHSFGSKMRGSPFVDCVTYHAISHQISRPARRPPLFVNVLFSRVRFVKFQFVHLHKAYSAKKGRQGWAAVGRGVDNTFAILLREQRIIPDIDSGW